MVRQVAACDYEDLVVIDGVALKPEKYILAIELKRDHLEAAMGLVFDGIKRHG